MKNVKANILLIGLLAFILVFPTVALAEEESLKDGMISHWTLDDFFISDDTVFDSYSDKQGTIFGATSVDANESEIAQSLYFDGSSWVDLGDGSSIAGATAFSISVWVKSDSTGLDSTIWRARDTDDMMLRYDEVGWKSGEDDVIQFDVDTNENTENAGTPSSGRARLESSPDKQTTEWQHLVATWNGSDLSLYINGNQDGYSIMIPNYGGGLYADRNLLAAAGNQDFWNGKLDEVAFWSRALSGDEISDIYDNGIPVTYEVPGDGELLSALEAASSREKTLDTIEISTRSSGDYPEINERKVEDYIKVLNGEDSSGLTFKYNMLLNTLTHNGTGTVNALFNYWGGGTPNVSGTGDSLYSTWLGTDPTTNPSSQSYIVDDIGANPSVIGYSGYLGAAFSEAGTNDTVNIHSDDGPADYEQITNRVLRPDIKILSGGSNLYFRRNQIEGTVTHNGLETADFLFNHWGSTPSIAGNAGNLLVSPWINTLPGTSSTTYVVDDVGAIPPAGFLYTAFDAAEGGDTVEVLTDENQDDYQDLTGLAVEEDIKVPAGESGSGLTMNHNNITGSLTHNGSGIVDALYNYWGVNGPQNNLSGNTSSILYSPWLNDTPGTLSMTYVVDDVGADPTGSLTRAIEDANNDQDMDTINVHPGDYTSSSDKPVTETVDIVTCTGCPVQASVSGELSIKASDVKVGGRDEYVAQGFNITGNVTVEGNIDASTVHINWNNIYGTVTNDAVGTLDATYNWWGDMNPEDSISGEVDYTPYLPKNVCSVLEYMEENNLEDPAHAVAGIVAESASLSEEVIAQLTGMGFDVEGAGELIEQYGTSRVKIAMNNADTSSKFVELLGGYSLPAGSAGGLTNNTVAGGAGSVGGRTVGAVFTKCETIEINFPLADFQGNPPRGLTPTVSLVKLDKDGNKKGLEKVTTATYDEGKTAYFTKISSCELTPGYYLIQIDLPDLSALTQVIQVKGKKA